MSGGRAKQILLVLISLCPAISRLEAQELKQRPASLATAADVVSHQRLQPRLSGSRFLRISPDGSYIFVQDGAGIFVLSREPLQLILYADLGEAYPAQFSADSRRVSLLRRDLTLITWQISDPLHPQERQLPAPQGCLDAQLAPDAAWIACLTKDFSLEIYRGSDFQRVFPQRKSADFSPAIRHPRYPISSYFASPSSAPFGFQSALDFAPLTNRGMLKTTPIHFSPDGKFLLFAWNSEPFRLELSALKKTGFPGSLHKHAPGIVGVPAADRVFWIDPKNESPPAISSLVTGEILSSLAFTQDTAQLATDSRYALLSENDAPATVLFDLQQNRPISIQPASAADVSGGNLVLLTPEGELRIYRMGEEQARAGGRLPPGVLPALRSALADASLSTLTVSVNGAGAVFDLVTGKRIANPAPFYGVSLPRPDSGSLLMAKRAEIPSGATHWTPNQTVAADFRDWTDAKALQLVPSQRVVLEYSFHDEIRDGFPVMLPDGAIPFNLRGLDPATGKELWKRGYASDPPIPFSDPQGTHIVLGWQAGTGSARHAARQFPGAQAAYKKQKIKEHDTFFEALDATTGTSLGGVLVQFGSGPASFDSAFSLGNDLFLVKDLYRISVFRLQEGNILARLRGQHLAASESAKMFALDDGDGKVSLYNLATATKIADRPLPDRVAYLRFSEDGTRLLVLTVHQEIFVLDLPQTLQTFPPTAAESNANPEE